jgi:hypothetical protein
MVLVVCFYDTRCAANFFDVLCADNIESRVGKQHRSARSSRVSIRSLSGAKSMGFVFQASHAEHLDVREDQISDCSMVPAQCATTSRNPTPRPGACWRAQQAWPRPYLSHMVLRKCASHRPSRLAEATRPSKVAAGSFWSDPLRNTR